MLAVLAGSSLLAACVIAYAVQWRNATWWPVAAMMRGRCQNELWQCTTTTNTNTSAPLAASTNQHQDPTPQQRHILSTARHREDGAWFTRRQPFLVFAYSAFFDDRPSLQYNQHTIRIILVSEVTDDGTHPVLFCGFFGSVVTDVKETHPDEVVSGTMDPIGIGVKLNETTYREYILSCPAEGHTRPAAVSVLASESDKNETFVMPVEYPQRAGEGNQSELAVCVSVSYGSHELVRLIEWTEMQRILGVSKITIYNNSLNLQAGEVFRFYSAIGGFVELRQSHDFVAEHGEPAVYLHMSPVINDCLYRNMYEFRKIVVIDLDEVILPRKHVDITSMLAYLEKQSKDNLHSAKNYIFRNAYFFLDLPPDFSRPAEMTFLRYRKRMTISPRLSSVKSIIDPMLCSHMHNHVCWKFTNKPRRLHSQMEVSPSVGTNNHYKPCHFDAYLRKDGICSEMLKTPVYDSSMLRHERSLTRAVRVALKNFELYMRESPVLL